MLDSLIGEVGSRLGLGDQARPLIQMLLGRIADPASGGVSGFLDRFRSAGLGDMVSSWLGSGSAPVVPSTEQVQAALGDGGSFLSKAASSLGLPHEKVGTAVAALIPMLISRLTSGGSVPSVLPPEFASLAREGQSLLGMGAAGLGAATAAASAGAARVGGAAAAAAPVLAQAGSTGGGIGKWLPWLIGALVVIFGINYCSKQKEAAPAPASPTAAAPAAPEPASPAPAAPAPAAAPAPDASAASAAIPTGAAVQDGVDQGMPLLRVFFDSGKTDVASEFAEKSRAMVEYLKANADVKAVVSGFNDPTGDAAKNAELSKQRAQAVRAALVQAGVAEDRTVLEKPAQPTDTAASNAALRRVDVMLRK
jgi:outer membrane protein OmpA-like peptidoglycan-associated protein/uncharacterized protein YidB (DUF937 family)